MKKLQYTTNDPASSTDYLAGDNTWKPMSGGGGGVPYTGATANVDLGEYGLSAGFIEFDTTPTSTPTTQGTMSWDVDHNTAQLVMNGTVGRLLEDVFYIVKNQTGVTIPKGTVVMSSGTLGASGRILIQPFLADGTYPSEYVMGVTAEAIANGADGMVVHFGQIRQFNTSAFADGDILYASSTTAGAFTTTSPTAPNNIVLVAIVIHAAANGIIQVRPTIGSNINKDEGVVITSPTNGQVLSYNSTSGLWVNSTSSTTTSKSFIGALWASLTAAAGATVYGSFTFPTSLGGETARIFVVPNDCTMSKFYVRMFSAQPATGSLTFTLRKNLADTSVIVTIAAGSVAGTEANSGSTSATYLAGDDCSIKVVNSSSSTSGQIHNVSIMIEI